MTCDVLSPFGFNNTGFMSAVGSTPAALAWIACAIPISLPSFVIHELRLMFWALNGATLYLLESILQRPVTIMLFPTSDAVPRINNFFDFLPLSILMPLMI